MQSWRLVTLVRSRGTVGGLPFLTVLLVISHSGIGIHYWLTTKAVALSSDLAAIIRRAGLKMHTLSFELCGLLLSLLLGFLHIFFASQSAAMQRGYRWAAGARDEPVPPLAGVAGRLARASANFVETFPFFASLVLAVHFSGVHSTLSTTGVALYVSGRAAYLPLYAFGVPVVRSLVWNVALVGIILLGVALLCPPGIFPGPQPL